MKKHTLIIGPAGPDKTAKVRELIGDKIAATYIDRDHYIAFKFIEGTDYLVFSDLDVIFNKYDLNFIDKLSRSEDAIIRSVKGGIIKVAMPEIIVTATFNINDPLPEIFNNSERWIVLTCNS